MLRSRPRVVNRNALFCRMADVHWADRYAVNGMFIREMLLRERNEITDECLRDRRVGAFGRRVNQRRDRAQIEGFCVGGAGTLP